MGMKTVAIIGALDEEVALIAKSLTHVTHTAKGSLDIVSGTVDSFGWFQQIYQHLSKSGFSASAFSNQSKGLALINLQCNIIDSFYNGFSVICVYL